MSLRPQVGPDHDKKEWRIDAPFAKHAGGARQRIVSPRSDVVIVEYVPSSGQTIRRVCEACRSFIETDQVIKRGAPFFKKGVGDPIYFMGAGVKYWSLIVPHYGRVAFHDMERGQAFLESFSYHQKKEWRDRTGVPFPYKFFRD